MLSISLSYLSDHRPYTVLHCELKNFEDGTFSHKYTILTLLASADRSQQATAHMRCLPSCQAAHEGQSQQFLLHEKTDDVEMSGSQSSEDWDEDTSTSDEDDEDDDEDGLAERNEICRTMENDDLALTVTNAFPGLAQPLYPGKDIKVRMNFNGHLCQAVIEIKKTNDSLMTGEEKDTELGAYRDLWEMVWEMRRQRGVFGP